MIVENRVLGELVAMLQEPMQGRQLQQKNSFLEEMLNKKVASEKLTMIDDPLIKKGSGSRLFDSQGLAAKKRIMIDKGLPRHYYADDYYSRKLGIEPTSGSVSNLVFEHGTRSVDKIIADRKKAILVAGFIGGNFNSTTGDFSFGVFGQLIENGALTRPISQMNISGNAKDFWNRILEIANDPDPYSSWRTPTMLFEAVSFSGL